MEGIFKMETYIVEIYGANNSFKVEATPEYEPCEDWLTGEVTYNIHLDSVKLVHGKRKREVGHLLTESQIKHIVKEIERQNLL